MRKDLVFLAGLILLSPHVLLGQEPRVRDADLPRWVEEDIISFFNDTGTIHFTGRSRIPPTRSIVGNVAALGGPFTVAGEVEGDLVVVNGDLVLESGGLVTGDVMIVGGRVLGEELGRISGDLRVFSEPLRYVQRGDRISAARRSRNEGSNRFNRDFRWGDARFTLKAGQNYNRVEGLPVIFGPSIRTAGPNPLKVDVWGVWRTEMGLELGEEDFGFQLRAEQALGGRDEFAIGGTGFSFVDPIEDWRLSNLEASLATFILHKDYRDYYERTGWSVFARLRFPQLFMQLKAEYFEEDHVFSPVAGPWSISKNDEPWREQPLVAEGKVRFVEGSLTIDTRNNRKEPSDGWYIEARTRHGLGGDLFLPAHRTSPESEAALIQPTEYDTDFITGSMNIRSYNRVGPSSSLSFRGFLGGTLNDVPLPPQFQHVLGGVGSLPGYALFAADCGARDIVRGYDIDIPAGDGVIRDPVFPRYGCDQVALFQAEFRGRLFVDWDFGGGDGEDSWEDDWDWYPRLEFSPDWSAFFNMGRGWTVDGLGDTETLMDVGIGLYLGDLGLYYAYPLKEDKSGGGGNGNFFIRLSRRF
jgi:cytoskeletal protein CcmA (bactofilin family)